MLKVAGAIPLDILARRAPPGAGDIVPDKVPKVLQLYPWWLYKPPMGQDLVKIAQNAFVAVGSATLDALTLQLDQSTMAIVRGLDLYVNDMTPTTAATFTFNINGNPVPGYGSLTPFPRTAASINQSFDTFIFVPAGSKVTVTAANADGGTYLVGFGYQGWTVPTNIDAILGIAGGAYTGVG
jgi:hypothetical protein